jgi:hypothetical protein
MGVLSMAGSYGDVPHQIRFEGQEITLTRINVDGNTVKLRWNIPESYSAKCDADRRAYDGIVITASNHTFRGENDAPKNGTRYNPDPTGSETQHMGSKINPDVRVVGAFYNDTTTVEMTVTDVDVSKPIYFSAFAVTKELEHHKEGVHAYELHVGDAPEEGDTQGYQQILMGFQENRRPFDINNVEFTTTGILANDLTGLDVGTNYTFDIVSDVCPDEHTITIAGADAQTYNDLVDAINQQIAQVGNPLFSAGAPNAGQLFVDVANTKLYSFDGETKTEQANAVFDSTDPSTPTLNEIWYDTDDNILQQWNGVSWVPLTYFDFGTVTSPFNPQYWIDTANNNAYKNNSNVWCELPYFNQTNDPAAAPSLTANGAYWFNETTSLVYELTQTTSGQCWHAVDVIRNEVDPNALPTGYYWFDDVANKLYIRTAGGSWNELTTGVIFSETAPTPITTGLIWVDTVNDVVNLANATLDGWDVQPSITWEGDPTNRDSCDLWWNSTDDKLYIWDVLGSVWVEVNQFFQQTTNPLDAPTIVKGSIWYNGTIVQEWDSARWNDITTSVVRYNTNPLSLTVGTDFIKDSDGKFYDATGTLLAPQPLTRTEDPYNPTTGDYWYDTTNNVLNQWTGTAWMSVLFVNTDPTPAQGFKYYDTVLNKLREWDGSKYIDTQTCATIGITMDGDLVFRSPTFGSSSYVRIDDNGLFPNLDTTVQIQDPRVGTDGLSGVPTYLEVGCGTDGSPDERRELADSILIQLGHPAVEVELTRAQINKCIDRALESLRKRSSIAYKRGFFFLNVEPNQQRYQLTDKRVGFNKIVDVMSAYRIQSSFLGNATGQGAYGQAMLQHLYSTGEFDLISYHVVSQYVELMNEMFAAYLTFSWDEHSRNLGFHQTFGSDERILLDVSVERTEQELIIDRWTKSWIERYALGEAKLILSRIRGKFASLPGAGGGIALNAGELYADGVQDIEYCWQQIEDYIVNNPEDYGYESGFILG